MTSLVNDIEALSHRVVLVLDDQHTMYEPDTRRWMRFLLENLSGPMHVVISTRSAPLLPTGRLRAQGDLTELRATDLLFSADEAASLLRGQLDIDLGDGDLEDLMATTEGWPTGVYLAGLFLQGGDGRSPGDFHGTHRHVAEFLRDEVYSVQPEPVREFMLRTSVLDRFSPALCEALTDIDGAGLILGDLERSNLFVVPLDDDAEWYRYHHLFRDMLRAEAARVIPAELPDLHRRACAWHRTHGTPVEAAQHATQAGDDGLVIDLIKSSWVVLGRSGHRDTVWSWIEGLPWDVARSDPHLCAIAAFLLTYGGEFEAAKVWLSRIPDRVPPSTTPLHDGFSSVEAIRELVLAHPGTSVSTSIRAARSLLELEPAGTEWRSAGTVALGVNLYLAGQLTDARKYLELARVESATAHRPAVQLMALAYLSLVEHAVGDPAAADELATDARRLMDEYDVVDYPPLAPLHMVSAALHAKRGDPVAAEAEIAEGRRLAAGYGRSTVPALTNLLGARIRLSLGDLAGCRELLREAHISLDGCTDPGSLRTEFEALDARTRPRAIRHDLPEALTASETSVLRLLATDLSLGEIAARLYVSINTIKTHTRHIYQKLRAPSRRAAVEAGRRLDLI
jgi:LuxR family maltose regulon positive regulatory protein